MKPNEKAAFHEICWLGEHVKTAPLKIPAILFGSSFQEL